MVRRLLAATCALLVLAAAAISGWLWYRDGHADVTPRSLYMSVVDATPSIDLTDYATDRCEEHGRTWTCEIPGAGGSGNAVRYRVQVRPGGSCWDARRMGAGFDMPRRASGCVRRMHS